MQDDFRLLKVLGWLPHNPSDDAQTLRHYRQFPDLELATCLHRERVKHFDLLHKYPDLKDPVIQVSHPQLPRLQNSARRIRLMEQIQGERIALSAGGSAGPDAESIPAPVAGDTLSALPKIDSIDSRSRDAEARTTEQDARPRERKYFDTEHERHAKLWEQVKGRKRFKFESWLLERKGKFSKTTFTDYVAGRILRRVSSAKRRLIEQEIRGSAE